MNCRRGLLSVVSWLLITAISFTMVPFNAFAVDLGGGTAPEEIVENEHKDVVPGGETPAENGIVMSGNVGDPAPLGGGDPAAATYTVTFLGWDGAVLAEQAVAEGGDAVAPAAPEREGYSFAGWDTAFTGVTGDLTVTALYDELKTFVITINYIIRASQATAAQPYVATVQEGAAFHETVASPAVTGYVAEAGSESIALDFDAVTEDRTYTVYYQTSTGNSYTVVHRWQNLGDDGYTEHEREVVAGETGAQTAAQAKQYAGLTLVGDPVQTAIAADGSTVITVDYNRNYYYVRFELGAGGTGTEPIVARFGAPIDASAIADPTRPGYTFGGWDWNGSESGNGTALTSMPAQNTVVTALWSGTQVKYTVVYWGENAGDGYAVLEYDKDQRAEAGSTVTRTAATAKHFEHFTFKNAETATAAGDGSTVINVYYTRDTYTLTFQKRSVHGWSTVYSEDFKYDADISAVWNLKVITDVATNWSTSISGYKYQTMFIAKMIGEDLTLRADSESGRYTYTWYYYLETLDGTAATAPAGTETRSDGGVTYYLYRTSTLRANSLSLTYDEDYFDIEGFDQKDSQVPSFSNYKAWLYYRRASFDLTFYNYNGNDAGHGGSFKFEADISGTNYTPSRPSTLAGYTFEGWFTTKDCVPGTEFNFTGAEMPGHDLILYAKWQKPSYEVTITIIANNQVQKVLLGECAVEPTLPDNPGYAFAGWFVSGTSTPFSFDLAITAPVAVEARWTAKDNIPYTVHFYKEGTVESVAPDAGGTGYMGTSVTVSAAEVEGWLPAARSTSVLLENAAGNEVTIFYAPFTSVDYTVRYEDAAGEQLADPVTKSSGDNVVTEQFKNIPGYSPDYYQKTLALVSDAAQNVITFVYTPNKVVGYTVEHWLQNADGVGYTKDTSASLTGAIGHTVRASANSYTGFSLNSRISKVSGVITDPAGAALVLRLYYDRNLYDYTAHFYLEGTTDSVSPDVTGSARFGATATVFAASPAGYKLVAGSVNEQAISITADAAANVATFYYEAVPSLFYTLNYLEQGTDAVLAAPFVSSADYFDGDTVTLSAAPLSLEKDGVVYDLVAGSYPASITLAEGGANAVSYYYASRRYAVTYNGNGATSGTAPADAATYVNGADVTVLGSGTLAKTGYFFLGWSTAQNAALADQTAPAGTLSAGNVFQMGSANVVLYAVWGKGFQVVYTAPDATSGTVPTDSGYYVSGAEAAVRAGIKLARTGYDFAGWKYGATTYAVGNKVKVDAPVVTLVAQWTVRSYDIVYKVDGADYDTERYDYGAAVTALTEPTKTGHTFSGWDWNGAEEGLGSAPATMPANDLEVTGSFTANEHDITYEITGDYFADADYKVIPNVAFGTALALIGDDMSREGYTFSGWSTLPAAMPDEAVTVTGSYSINKYDITYKITGSLFADDAYAVIPEVAYGTALSELADDMSRTGYTFSGWDWNGSEEGLGSIPATMPDAALTAEGSYTVNSYEVVYSVDGAEYDRERFSYGAAVTVQAEPSRTGYTFSGWDWNGSEEGLGSAPATMPANDVAASGSFTVNQYALKITYVGPNDGVFVAPTAVDRMVNYGTGYDVDSPAVTGYTADIAEVAGTMDENGRTVTVTYSANGGTAYTVTYHWQNLADDGYTADAALNRIGVTGQPVSESPIGRTGFTLNAANSVLSDDTLNADGSTELHLYYDRNLHSVSYAVTGSYFADADYKVITGVKYGAALTELADDMSRTGHTFSGWDWNGSAAGLGSIPATMPDADIAAEGSYSINQYPLKITYVGPNDGIFSAPTAVDRMVDYGTGYDVDSPAVTGYTADIAEIAGTMDENGRTVTVTYSANSDTAYTVTYYWQNLVDDGYTADAALNKSGVTGQPVSETAGSYTGFTFNAAASTVSDDKLNADGSTELHLYYDRNLHSVSYAVTGGYFADADYKTITGVKYGAALTELADDMSRTGHTFSGWDWNGSAAGLGSIPATMPDADIAAEGSYEIHKFSITYEITGSYFADPAYKVITEVPYGTALSLIGDDMTQSGHTFKGWQGLPATMPDGPVTVSGSYDKNKYPLKITYVGPNDGIFVAPPVFTSLEYFGKESTVVHPAVTGYTPEVASSTVTMDDKGIELTITYTGNKHSLKINYLGPNDGLFSAPAAVDTVLGYGTHYDYASPSLVGYLPDLASVAGSMPDADVTVDVTYAVQTYNILYYVQLDGVTVGGYSQRYAYGSAVTPLTYAVEDGYAFSGWDYVPAIMPADVVVVHGTLTRIGVTPIPTPAPTGPIDVPTPTPTGTSTPTPTETPIEIIDEPTPLAGSAWSLVDLILTILSVIGSIVLLPGLAGLSKDEQEERAQGRKTEHKAFWRFASLVPAVTSVLVFVLTQDLTARMVMTDKWTVVFAVVTVVQLANILLARKKDQDQPDAEA